MELIRMQLNNEQFKKGNLFQKKKIIFKLKFTYIVT